MRDLPLAEFLDQLAARVPAPGGGAVAALHAAQAAALLGMVARYSAGPAYAPHRTSWSTSGRPPARTRSLPRSPGSAPTTRSAV